MWYRWVCGCVCAIVLRVCCNSLVIGLRQKFMNGAAFPLWMKWVIHEETTGEWVMEKGIKLSQKALEGEKIFFGEDKIHEDLSLIFFVYQSGGSFRISLQERGSWLWLRPRVWWLQEIRMAMARLGWKVRACKISKYLKLQSIKSTYKKKRTRTSK